MVAVHAGDGFESGIVTRDGERLVAFYRDLLGFSEEPGLTIPGHCHIHKLRCGSSVLRVVVPETPPVHDHAGGEFMASTGLRYLWLQVTNLHEVAAAVADAGCAIAVPPVELRPGRTICQVQDPDGNHVELVQDSGG